MAVVEVQAGVALPGPPVGVEVGLAGPWTLGEEHAVVFQQRTLAEVQLGDRAGVVDHRAIVGTLGLGPPPLGIEKLVERDRVGVVGRLHRLDLPLRCDAAVEVGLRQGEVGVDIPHRLDQGMGSLELLVLEPGPLAGELELVMADGGQLAAEAERHQELGSGLPLLKLAAEERRVGAGAEQRIAWVGFVAATTE